MINARIFNGEIRRLSQLSIRRPEKLFETIPRFLYCRHAIPLANFQPELAHRVEYDIGDIERLELCIRCLRDVSKLEDFLNCG